MTEMSNALWEAIVVRDRRAVARLGDPNTDTALRAEMDRRALVAEVRHLKARLADEPEVTITSERGAPTRCRVVWHGREVFSGVDDSARLSDGLLPVPLVVRQGDPPAVANALNERVRRACEGPEA